MNTIAQQYVRLTLAVGQQDADYVGAYYGPAEWKPGEQKSSLEDFVEPPNIAKARASRWKRSG